MLAEYYPPARGEGGYQANVLIVKIKELPHTNSKTFALKGDALEGVGSTNMTLTFGAAAPPRGPQGRPLRTSRNHCKGAD